MTPHRATLEKDTCKTYEDAMLEIYRKLRPGEPPRWTRRDADATNLFFDPRRYDLSVVGRYKFNKKLSLWSAPVTELAARGGPRTGEICLTSGDVLPARGPQAGRPWACRGLRELERR